MDLPFLPLVDWNLRWFLSGDQVICKVCRRQQSLVDSRAFNHGWNCSAESYEPQYPGRELAQVIQQKISAGLY